MANRIQRKRTKGWRMPDGAVYVGRPTKWGNPFVCEDVNKAVEAFRLLCEPGSKCFDMGPGKLQFAKDAHPMTLEWWYSAHVRANLHELCGKDLACWCPLGSPCHADVLLELANR